MRFFLDLEFTPVGEYQECLSIGVVKAGPHGGLSDSFYRVIRTTKPIPRGYKGFTREDLKAAIPFTQMCRELKAWIGRRGMVYCYSSKDIEQFKKDCQRLKVPYFLEGRLFDLQPVLMHDLNYRYLPSLEAIKRRLGSTQSEVLHHALVDACDLMLIKQAVDRKQPMRPNPLYRAERKKQEALRLKQQEALRLKQVSDLKNRVVIKPKKCSKPLLYPPMLIEWTQPAMDMYELIVKSTVELEKIKIWGETGGWNFWNQPLREKQPNQIPASDLLYQVSIQRSQRNIYEVCYYKDSRLVLKAAAKITQGSGSSFSAKLLTIAEYQVDYNVLTEEGRKIVESGLLGAHLNLTTRHRGSFLTHHTFGETMALWCWITFNQPLKAIDRTNLPMLQRPIGVIQSDYQYTPSGYLPVAFKVVQVTGDLEQVHTVQTFELPATTPRTRENIIAFVQTLIQHIEACQSLQWFAIETKSLKIWVERAGGLKPRLIDLTAMERRMAIAMNQTFLYERKMLLRFANYLGFPIETATRWDQELEAYLHLIRYSKGFVVKEETSIVLERLTLQLSPWDQQLLMTSE